MTELVVGLYIIKIPKKFIFKAAVHTDINYLVFSVIQMLMLSLYIVVSLYCHISQFILRKTVLVHPRRYNSKDIVVELLENIE